MLKNVKSSSSDNDEKNALSDRSDSDGNETFNDNGFDQSDDDDAEEEIEQSTLPEVKKFENEEKPPKKEQQVKLEEDEVKMEVESESEGEEFDGSKMEPESESDGNEEHSNSFDTSAAPRREGFNEQENMETKKGEIRKRRQKRMPGESPYRPYKASITPCEICGQIFGPSDMVKHMVTHTGARDYKCDICSESFPQQSILNRFEHS